MSKSNRQPSDLRAHGDRRWYTVKAAAQSDPAEVLIYDEIGAGYFGGGISAEQFVADVKGLNLSSGAMLRVRINSPGGDLFDGTTIYNFLRSTDLNINVRIDGVAASAASIIAMAGNTVTMPENSFLMIHNPWMLVAGDARLLRKIADDLDVLREGAISTYKSRAGDNLSRDEIGDMLDAETWIGAQDAVKYGFADHVDVPVKAAALAKFDFIDLGLHPPRGVLEQQVAGVIRQEKRDRLAALVG